MLARRVKLHVIIGGHDATNYLASSVMEFEYIDHESGKADEIRLSLHDRDGRWSGDWRPGKGTEIQASFTVINWLDSEQEITFPCGRFVVDEIEFSGPPDRVEIKALSASLTSSIRDTKRTQAWERYSLQGIAAEIADRNGLGRIWPFSSGSPPPAASNAKFMETIWSCLRRTRRTTRNRFSPFLKPAARFRLPATAFSIPAPIPAIDAP